MVPRGLQAYERPLAVTPFGTPELVPDWQKSHAMRAYVPPSSLLPYVVPAAESAGFNWRHPRLCDIPFDPQEKSSMFLECVLDKALVELCLQGEDSMEKAKLFSDWVMKVMCFLWKSREPHPRRGNLLSKKIQNKKKKKGN